MHIFGFRDQIIHDYATYIKNFIQIRDTRISEYTGQNLNAGILWPEPLIQLNPIFEPGEWMETLITQGALHQECARIFRKAKGTGANGGDGKPLRLHRHQVEAIYAALTGEHYVLTTGTGSGKSLAYIVPIVNHVLQAWFRPRYPGDRRLSDERLGQQPGRVSWKSSCAMAMRRARGR